MELLLILIVIAILFGITPFVLTVKALVWGIILVIGIIVLVRVLRGERL